MTATTATFNIEQDRFCCIGDWTLNTIAPLEKRLNALPKTPTALVFDGSDLNRLDTAGAWLLQRTANALKQQGQKVDWHGFKNEHQTLLDMVARYGEALQPVARPADIGFFAEVGRNVVELWLEIINFWAFLGENVIVNAKLVINPRRIRWAALFSNLYHSGITALPIVGLMSFLIGIVIAYQGGMQLKLYGANILVADLVGITLLRELAPLLTAIVIAGRSGSAYTAQIGTMLVTEEVDALRTIGISPLELLVFPKVLALMIVLPLLTAYADVLGIFGAMVIAALSLDVSFTEFLDRLQVSLTLSTYLIGIGKAPVFAIIIALVGCYHGFQASGSADSVGQKVTISVVQAIFLVIVSDAVFAVMFGWLGI